MQTQLRDVRLESLRFQDLAAALFLYEIWDTKGWIEFKRGDLDAAEQYINAAWQASGSGTIGEHLGEIYEKQGKREQAIHAYIQALAGDTPSDTARARLTALGVNKGIEPRVEEARRDLRKQRTSALPVSGNGSAQFYLLISPGKVEQVKFIKGSEGLKSLSDVLQKAELGMQFPTDGGSTRGASGHSDLWSADSADHPAKFLPAPVQVRKHRAPPGHAASSCVLPKSVRTLD